MPPGFHALIAAQFASGLADNALLIVAIALLPAQGLPGWTAPLLKFSFTLAYVLLAPFVGALADRWPKGRVMMAMNALKALGLGLLAAGLHPLLAFAVIGLGAALYSPAKYGLVTELVPAPRLVAANGWLEVSMVGAILLGTVLGGLLAQPALLPWALALVGAVYGLAALLNLAVPASGACYAAAPPSPRRWWRQFWRGQRRLWADPEGGLSLAATTLFWGAGATLQFIVLRWAVDQLGLGLDRAAWLQAVVAVGVLLGAAWAGRRVALADAARVLPCGVLLGALLPLLVRLDSWAWALPLLVLVGALGGALLVPMNALLQHRGARLLTAGRSIAVQNFNENLAVLVMLGGYAGAMAWPLPLKPLVTVFGSLLALAVLALWAREHRRQRGRAMAPRPLSG